jgi:hypothetical protein
LGIELMFGVVQDRAVVAGDESVIDMDRKHEEVVTLSARIEAWVCLGQFKTLGFEPFVECLVR